jgi:adhesin HecA-like repeat protein
VRGTAYAVDITQAGGLTAGRVQLIVTDQGAGVRSAGTLNATAGDAVVQANGDITVAGGSVRSANDVTMTTPGVVSVQGANIAANDDVSINAGSIAISDIAASSSTLAAGNAIALTASGDISNTGILIQAGLVQPDGTLSGGDLTLNAGGSITNRSDAANLGILFSANGQAVLKAQGDITNDNARILANGNVTLAAQGNVNNVIDHAGGVNGGTPAAYFDEGGRFLFFQHTSSGFNVDYGTVTEPDQLATIASTGGNVTVSGRNVTNSGGVIQSDDGDVNITAQNAFTNGSVFSGQASYSHSCFIFCHGSASSSVTPSGGTIQAGGNVAIKAGTSAANIGGNVYAHGNLTVDAPLAYATGVTGYSSINQDRGFKAFFGSTWAQLIAMDIGGGFTADGLVTLTGDAIINGGYVSGGQGQSVSGQVTTLRAPSRTPVQIGQHLGLMTWLWF